MNMFDKVIGYDSIKNELLQICDIISHPEVYEKLGAKIPKGVLLYGAPGLGKTLMAHCFMEETGLKSYTVRKTKGGNDFLTEIADTFNQAKENAPSIILFDDLDKFSGTDDDKPTVEFTAIQAGIDEVKDDKVFVMATVNTIDNLPDSLLRSGRFDCQLRFWYPDALDAQKIISYYLQDKKVANDINIEDLVNMMQNCSCASMESILNEAAITAAYKREDEITMPDIIRAVLKQQYSLPDSFTKLTSDKLRSNAIHEAGHLVVAEVLQPSSVGLASVRVTDTDSVQGFIHLCKQMAKRSEMILVSLAGKAAVELYNSETCAGGCQSDLNNAMNSIRAAITESGTLGMGMLSLRNRFYRETSDKFNEQTELVVHAELERYMFIVKDILNKHRSFLDNTVKALMEKEVLTYSDIKQLRDSNQVTLKGETYEQTELSA